MGLFSRGNVEDLRIRYPMHYQSHSVVNLECHLENQQRVTFVEGNEERALDARDTKLMAWFRLNQTDQSSRDYTYCEIPKFYTWQDNGKVWRRRVRGQNKVIPRLNVVSPKNVELFHLRLLLLHVKGAQSFQDIRNFNGTVYETYREATIARGIAESSQLSRDTLQEAVFHATPNETRNLFGWLLGINVPTESANLWNELKNYMIENFQHQSLTEEETYNRTLIQVEDILITHNTCCRELGLPVPNRVNRVLNPEDRHNKRIEYEELYTKANGEQKAIIDLIIQNVENTQNTSKMFYLDAPAGCGKTFIQKTLLAKLKSMDMVVLPVAFTGIAASLIEGGRTLHNQFKLPIPIMENSVSGVTPNSSQGEYLNSAKLIIIDEGLQLGSVDTIRHAGVVGLWGLAPAPIDKLTMIRQSSLTRLGVMINTAVNKGKNNPGNGDIQWCFSQVKGTLDDDVTEADIISCVEFNHDGDLLATGDKGGRVVIFQRDPISKNCIPRRGEYNVYSTFQSHEPEFDYLKSLEIEEKINKIRWLKRKNQAHFLLSTNDKTIKLWKVSERDKRVEGYNTKEENGQVRDPSCVTSLRVPVIKPMELMVEASPRRIFANAHTYHINSISVNSDQETYLSADDLRINLWHLEITDQSFNIVDIKPSNMEELTEVITAAEFHPLECNLFVYSSSKGTIRLCDMRQAALCDRHSKLFEEPEDPTNRSFFSEIISSISDVKISNSGRYMISRDYLSVKVWDLHMETKPIESYPVHEYLRSKLCSLYENDCIFDKFECCWSGNDSCIMTGSYNNFFRMFDRVNKRDATLEAAKEIAKPKTVLKPRKVCTGGKRKKDEISVDCLDFNKKILHTAWHPSENIIAVAATNNLFLLQDKL